MYHTVLPGINIESLTKVKPTADDLAHWQELLLCFWAVCVEVQREDVAQQFACTSMMVVTGELRAWDNKLLL